MSQRRRRRGNTRSRIADAPGGLLQLPRGPVRNPYPPLQVLGDGQLERVHQVSLRILEVLGIEVMNERALDLFETAGALVDRETQIVRLGRDIVDAALATTVSNVHLVPRNPENALMIGNNSINFTLVAGPPNVHDRERGRRPGNYQDYCDLIRLAQHFNVIHMLGNQVCAPVELPANTRHLDTYLANLTLTDKSFHLSAIGAGRVRDGVEMMAISRGLSLDEMVTNPSLVTIISVNSPRRYDGAMLEGLMTMAELGQAVCVTPFTLMGAMTPVTLAAALAQQNAEALLGVVLTQLVRPGAPVIYGAFTSNVDMKSGAPAFGTPENAKANVASGQLARKYRLPYRTTPGNASNAADAQGAYETMMALWGAVLGHGNLVYHAAGWQEGGLTASFEKLVMDVEMIQHMVEFLKPVVIDDAELAFDAIANVSPGGHFFGEAHTLERYDRAFYQPMLSNWQNFEAWQEAGSKTAEERATEIWKQALADYEEPALDPAIREELEAYVARRKQDIGDNEP